MGMLWYFLWNFHNRAEIGDGYFVSEIAVIMSRREQVKLETIDYIECQVLEVLLRKSFTIQPQVLLILIVLN